MNDLRGARWRIWDLHVHTPASLIHNYTGNKNEQWKNFLADIESLPSEFKVIGVNDYIFLDGYRRIISERDNGRLQNIDLILPVIELRLDKFGGTDSKLSRINFHIIFSDQLGPDLIQDQFINALPSAYHLTPEYESIGQDWKAISTRESLIDLGKKIIASVPDKEKAKFGPPILEGFNSLCFKLKAIKERLDTPYFKGKHLTAVGKTEWWDIKWNAKSVAEKKNVINSSDFIFISADSPASFYKAKEQLTLAKVNNRLLDCSDAHHYSNSNHKDRIGNCYSWIKADTTFDGLRIVPIEPEERIYIGEVPQQFRRVRANPTKFIQSIDIRKKRRSKFSEKWFDTKLEFNHGLVAIIGNKGSGKSALADVLGLLGNSKHQDVFSFLNNEKFLKPPEEKGQHFEGKLFWESGDENSSLLNSDVDLTEEEGIKYIPQNYFETICTEIGDIESSAFYQEIKEVIFSHIDQADRLGQPNLDRVIEYKSSEIRQALENEKARIRELNHKIIQLEEMLKDDYRRSLENSLKAKKGELDAHNKTKPKEISEPPGVDKKLSQKIKKAEEGSEQLDEEIAAKESKRVDLAQIIVTAELLLGKIENFETQYKSFKEDFSSSVGDLEIEFDDLVQVKINKEPLEKKIAEFRVEKENIETLLSTDEENSLKTKQEEAIKMIKELQEKLDKPSKEYQSYLQDHGEWEKRLKKIIGDKNKIGTLMNLEWQINDLNEIPERLAGLYSKRKSRTRVIYRNIKKHKDLLAEMYTPIRKFFEDYKEVKKELDLKFDVSVEMTRFQEQFFEWINLGKAGSFIGKVQGAKRLKSIIDNHDFNKEQSTLQFTERIIENLKADKREADDRSVEIEHQLTKGRTVERLYNFIFSLEYLKPRYILKLGEKELSQLSPGERGALLIVFYLLIDRDTIPLIIDQPELNLDNETVTKLLVRAIKEAKLRRQIIIITHNPILAVVCNADQIICASLDLKHNYEMKYISGAIENPIINRKIVDILEGTMLSFDNRQKKYLREFFEKYAL